MSEPLRRHSGTCVVLDRPNVDTDQIIPKQFLAGTARTGLGDHAFHDWRYRADGAPDPAFELNHPEALGASILVAGPNFGCGSSREHAVWALHEVGFRAIVAASFGDIFAANCCRNGVVPARVPPGAVAELVTLVGALGHGCVVTVDLERLVVRDAATFTSPFTVDPYGRELLLRGADPIGLTLQDESRIAEFEARRARETYS
jgi:3-isopropylmalate/(R)-2-methylmalate dehydratase small subunit